MQPATLPDPEAIRVARAFLARVAGHYPVVEGWLFGSRARGDARADSDLDVAIILDGPKAAMRQASVDMAGEAFDLMLETGLVLSPIAIAASDWTAPEHYSNPFFIRNIRREGLAL